MGTLGDSRVRHSKEILRLCTPGETLGLRCRKTLVEHTREDSGLGTPGRQGHFEVGYSMDDQGVDRARRRVPGEEQS